MVDWAATGLLSTFLGLEKGGARWIRSEPLDGTI